MHVSRPCFCKEQGNVGAQAGHGMELEASRKMGALGRNPLSLGLGVLVLEGGWWFMGRCAEEGLHLHLVSSQLSGALVTLPSLTQKPCKPPGLTSICIPLPGPTLPPVLQDPSGLGSGCPLDPSSRCPTVLKCNAGRGAGGAAWTWQTHLTWRGMLSLRMDKPECSRA